MHLYNLDKWRVMRKDESVKIEAPADHNRVVTLYFNAPYPTRIYRVLEGGEVDFLCKVDGLDEVKFSATGAWLSLIHI